ncbi:hypothetical protein E2562_004313 [Oryza meyeriana var. granulata]|uniref:Uncharacterized protein n=1 Tax=Oryza meyeriana var. granulata TaxID=110450 RepID=A0A6G1BSM7_9ORYZ|nr:hypothetical protein E2562_004313 [Oryza meyeriana var. granulata]
MALRRLAGRILLHRVASLPPPRPPPAFLSSESRGHLLLRFSTSSSTPPHFMVQYLVSSCGLSPAEAAEAAPRFAHLDSASRPDAALAFLRSQGLSRAQVRAVVSCKPKLLLSDVEATLRPKFRAVRAVGLSRADVARLFALYPPALTFGVHTNLLPRILFWLDFLGSAKLLMKWLNKTWLLMYSVDILLRNLFTLRALGIPDSRITTTVRLQPTLIMQSAAKFQRLVGRVEACAVPPSSGMYMWAFFTLHNVSESAFPAKKAAVMGAAGCTEEEFDAMFRRAPCFMFLPAELLQRKVEFLLATAGCDTKYIVNNPVLLTLSLSKRMVPRCRVIETLRSRGVDIGKTNLRSIMRWSEAKFVERYILRYKQEVPELLELYPPRHG